MMTMLVATLGLLPAAMSHGIGSDSQRPFAIVIVGGLMADLVMSIFLLPTLYVWIARETDKLPEPEAAFEGLRRRITYSNHRQPRRRHCPFCGLRPVRQAALTWDQVKAKFEAANPSLKADQANVEEMKAEEITAFLRPNPQFTMRRTARRLHRTTAS